MVAAMHRLFPAIVVALLALIAVTPPAWAGERNFIVTQFDRVRVDGPFDVRVTVDNTSGSKATATGDDKALGSIELSVQGTTLVVRKGNLGWNGPGRTPVVVSITMPTLRAASVVGGGKLALAGRLQGDRIDFTVTGAGSINAQGIDTQDLIVTLIGTGNVALAGKSAHARLLTNGNGMIAAMPLSVGDVVVRLDGPGSTEVTARFNADVTTTGLGAITVGGKPRCRPYAPAGGPIICEGVRAQ